MKDVWELNPRGELWANDENSFGQQFLLKLGWKKGKGLGKNENGISKCITIQNKNNKTGIGWKNNAPIGGFAQEYTELLSKLNEHYSLNSTKQNDTLVKTCTSLEEYSKKLKNRLHYQKFIKRKDLTQYTENDLQSIFGANHIITENDNYNNELEIVEPNLNCNALFNSHKNSLLTISEYFENKMKLKTQKNIDLESQQMSSNNSRKRKKERSVDKKKHHKKFKFDLQVSSQEDNNPSLHSLMPSSTYNSFKSELSNPKKNTNKRKSLIPNKDVLKSCLKKAESLNNAHSRKNVTFNENVSYFSYNVKDKLVLDKEKMDSQISLNDLNGETNTNLNCINSCNIISGNQSQNMNVENLGEETLAENISIMNPQRHFIKALEINDRNTALNNTSKCLNSYSQLPPFLKSDYRQQINQKNFKIKKIKKKIAEHYCLKTTNLASINGYGNW